MSTFVKAVAASDVAPGQGKTVEVGGKKIAIFNVDGAYHALDDTCAHRGGPLGEGTLSGKEVTCPWHGWPYDVTTGECTLNPSAKVCHYPTKIVGGEVQVEI